MKRFLLVIPVVVLAACGTAQLTQPAPSSLAPASSAPSESLGVTAPGVPAVKILPASSHVTGHYAASCTLGRATGNKPLPDPMCTPGGASSAVTQANIHGTVCVSGYTSTIRPPSSETGAVKVTAMRAYREVASSSTATELDHLVPLELGGSNDVSNLWPQPSDIANAGFRNTKDKVENDLHAALCKPSSTLKLTDLQSWIANDWTTAEHKAGLN